MKWSFFAFLMIVVTYFWINIPSLHDGLFHVIDNVQVTRVEAMFKELKSGQFPVRYVDAFGHGSGNFIFKYYSPLIYYIGSIFQYFGFSSIKAVKLIYLVMTATGALGMWLLLGSVAKGRLAKTLGTIAFITAPYFYHDFFHRGSLTEASALALIPWVWLIFLNFKNYLNRKQIVVGAIVLAAIILTHSLTAIMMIGTLALYLLISSKNLSSYKNYILAMILGCGLAAFSLVPALMEKNITKYESNELVQTGYIDHPIPVIDQFLGTLPSKTAHLGFTLSIVLILTTFSYIKYEDFRVRYQKILNFILIISYVGFYLMSPSSSWLWENILYLRYFQFPFRLLTVVTAALSVAFAILIEYYKEKRYILVFLGTVLFLPLIFNNSYYRVAGYQYGTKYTVDDPCMTNTWADEYLSIWTSKCLLTTVPNLITPIPEDAQVSDNGRTIRFDVGQDTEYTVAKYYFPEWRAIDQDNVPIKVEPVGDNGLIKVIPNANTKKVVLRMEKSKASAYGDTISLMTLIVCILLLIYDFLLKGKQKLVKQMS